MGAVKEYFCPGHGEFEADKPVCPHGCNVAEREFRTPPAIGTGTVGRTDKLLRAQASAHGVSNFRTAHEGESSRTYNPAADKMAAFNEQVRKKFPSNWGAVAKGGVYKVGQGVEGAGPGAPATVAAMGAEPTNAIEQAKSMLTPPPVTKIRDPQNLKVDISKAA